MTRAAITGASVVSGFFAGKFVTADTVKNAQVEGEAKFATFRAMQNQAENEQSLFEASLPEYKQHISNALEAGSSSHADKVLARFDPGATVSR